MLTAAIVLIISAFAFGCFCDAKHKKEEERIERMTDDEYTAYLKENGWE